MFEACELLQPDSKIQFINLKNKHVELALPTGSFTYPLCQTPIIYHQSTNSKLVLTQVNRAPCERNTLSLTDDETASVFSRTGQIIRIDIFHDFQPIH